VNEHVIGLPFGREGTFAGVQPLAGLAAAAGFGGGGGGLHFKVAQLQPAAHFV